MSETDSDLDFESADEDAEFASNIKTEVESEKCSKKLNQLSETIEVEDVSIHEVNKSPKDVAEEGNVVKSVITSRDNKSFKDVPEGSSAAESVITSEGNISSEGKKSSKSVPEGSSASKCAIASEGNKNTKDVPEESNTTKSKIASEDIKSFKDAPEGSSAAKSVITSKVSNTYVPSKGNETSEITMNETQNVPTEENTSTLFHSSQSQTKVMKTDYVKSESSSQPEAKTDPHSEPDFKPNKPRVVLRIEKKKQQSQLAKEASVETKEKASDLVNILREEPPEPQSSSWGFSSWGTSLLSTAASSVSTFSNQVSQGIGTVLDTVESTLGAPAPEDLATVLSQRKKEKDNDLSEEVGDETYPNSSLLPDVSSWTKVLENTGSKVLFGGLDTLELIGKKTMDILTEGDPGLRKKRAVFSEKVNVAELLREARAKAEEQDLKDGVKEDTIHYSQIFDEKQGLVHLEALEMLSNQSQVKLQRLLMRHSKNVEVKKRLEEIKSICENIPSIDDLSDCENLEDFETVFKKHALELSLPLNIENIIKVQKQINDDIANCEIVSEDDQYKAKEIFRASICSLAEFTAKCIETFHKVSELIIVQSRLDPDIEHCVTILNNLTTVMCVEVNNMSTKYHKCLDAAAKYNENKETSEGSDVTAMATNLYVEASNSNKYIQDAYLMLVPVLQVCLLETLN